MYRSLDQALAALEQDLLNMLDRVDEQLTDAADAFLNLDIDLAQQIRHRDDAIDALQLEIDATCERLIALHQPVASDLRLLLSAMKITTDLERIGDYAKHLAPVRPDLTHALVDAAGTRALFDTARAMLRDVHAALKRRDRVLAREVLARDLQMDRLYKEHLACVVSLFQEQHAEATAFVHLLHAGRGLERIADHTKNIARGVVFIVEGLDLRHRRRAATLRESKP